MIELPIVIPWATDGWVSGTRDVSSNTLSICGQDKIKKTDNFNYDTRINE